MRDTGEGLCGPWVRFAAIYSAVALFFGVSVLVFLRRYPIGKAPAAAIYFCLMLLFGLCLAPGFPSLRSWLTELMHPSAGGSLARAVRLSFSILALLFPYLIYSAGTGDFRWLGFAKLFGLAAFPFALFALAPVRKPQRLNWQDVVVLLWLIWPVLFGRLGGIWNVPVNLDFMNRLFLIAAGSWSFLIWRGVEGSGYEFSLSAAAAGNALVFFAAYAVIAIPLGFGLHFIIWNPRWRGVASFAFDYITLFAFVAVAEELFFRGLLQNLLEGSLRSRYAAQGVASVIFGLSHIGHAPFPNWRYVILASVAGWFYGSAYRSRRSLMASSLTHALVDTVWRTWFTLPLPR